MKPAVKRTFDRRGARAKAQSSPPCSFIRLISPWIAEQFHPLKLSLKLSRQWGAPHQLPGQNLWLVVDEDFPGRKAQFKLKGYLGHEPEYLTARRKAGTAVRKWQELIYSKASTGDLSCLPAKDNIRAAILCLAVQKDDTAAITALCQAGVDVNSGNGRALRRAMRTHRRHAVLALLQAGASVQITFQLGFTPQLYGSPESWFNLVEDLICIIADANLDEGLPVFRDLAKMAGDPACRSLIVRLATKYPSLLAQLL